MLEISNGLLEMNAIFNYFWTLWGNLDFIMVEFIERSFDVKILEISMSFKVGRETFEGEIRTISWYNSLGDFSMLRF